MCMRQSNGSINIINYDNPEYPIQPDVNCNCSVNQIYKTIPNNFGDCTYPSNGVEWEIVASSPSTIKQLYTGVPNSYPIRTTARPKNTLYGFDFSQFEMTGENLRIPKRMSYHYKVYPFTHRHARELRHYEPKILPYMDNTEWTRYPVTTDASLNLPKESIL